jgi:hypothetical protein
VIGTSVGSNVGGGGGVTVGASVGGTGVSVGGTGVSVGGTGVFVGGTGVSVGGAGVSVGRSVGGAVAAVGGKVGGGLGAAGGALPAARRRWRVGGATVAGAAGVAASATAVAAARPGWKPGGDELPRQQVERVAAVSAQDFVDRRVPVAASAPSARQYPIATHHCGAAQRCCYGAQQLHPAVIYRVDS